VREGADITVAAYGPMVKVLHGRRDPRRPRTGTSIEVLDLRSLSPLDMDTIVASVRRTSRLVVVHEGPDHVGLGAEIAAQVTENCFHHLDGARCCAWAGSTPRIRRRGSRRSTCPTSTACSTPWTVRLAY